MKKVFYDIKQSKKDINYGPDLSKFRKCVFWDTTFDKNDWKLMKVAIIKRILVYGNLDELEEITQFDGKHEVDKIKIIPHMR